MFKNLMVTVCLTMCGASAVLACGGHDKGGCDKDSCQCEDCQCGDTCESKDCGCNK